MGRSSTQKFLLLAGSNGELLIPCIVLQAAAVDFFCPHVVFEYYKYYTSVDLHAGVC
jgi:hypothetical protein